MKGGTCLQRGRGGFHRAYLVLTSEAVKVWLIQVVRPFWVVYAKKVLALLALATFLWYDFSASLAAFLTIRVFSKGKGFEGKEVNGWNILWLYHAPTVWLLFPWLFARISLLVHSLL